MVNTKLPKRKNDINNNKKNVTTKPESKLVNEIKVSHTDSSITIEDDESVG